MDTPFFLLKMSYKGNVFIRHYNAFIRRARREEPGRAAQRERHPLGRRKATRGLKCTGDETLARSDSEQRALRPGPHGAAAAVPIPSLS
jgi:hypothetical protein